MRGRLKSGMTSPARARTGRYRLRPRNLERCSRAVFLAVTERLLPEVAPGQEGHGRAGRDACELHVLRLRRRRGSGIDRDAPGESLARARRIGHAQRTRIDRAARCRRARSTARRSSKPATRDCPARGSTERRRGRSAPSARRRPRWTGAHTCAAGTRDASAAASRSRRRRRRLYRVTPAAVPHSHRRCRRTPGRTSARASSTPHRSETQ